MFTKMRHFLCIMALLAAWSLVGPGSATAQSRAPAAAAPEREGPAGPGTSAEVETPGRSANYQLNAGDTVAVKVFREPSLDLNQRISKDGTINFPLLGVIRIAGRTTNDAATMIANLLDKDYIVHPQVAVSISTYTKQKYTVLGQVSSPGSYEIPEEQTMDILTAIAKAGGFARLANPSKVTVRRVTDGREQVFSVDAKRLMNDKNSSRFFIQPNDTISVAERFF